MQYDFDTPIERRGSDSLKWSDRYDPGLLPMWVADMDFKTLPEITQAIIARAEHGIFGYTEVKDEYYQCIIDYYSHKHGLIFSREDMLYTIGVVPALSVCIKALCKPGESVLIQTPVYNCFFSAIANNEIQALHCPLLHDKGRWQMDLEGMEKLSKAHRPRVFILCNPHNPVGRVWHADELLAVGKLCGQYGITVISDEIHNEITFRPNRYVPFASLSPEFFANSITLFSPSKAFNLASLQMANIVCNNAELRHKIKRAIHVNDISDVNPFGQIAAIAAYTHGQSYLEQLLDYIWSNYEFARAYLAKHMPRIGISRLEGTYLMFLDCSCMKLSCHELHERLIREHGLMLSPGSIYGPEGEGFMRMNLGTQRMRVAEGLKRLQGLYDNTCSAP